MKRFLFHAILFFAAFSSVYLICCYAVPELRIKLAADPITYFLESLRSLVLIKSLISLTAGLFISALPFILKKIRAS